MKSQDFLITFRVHQATPDQLHQLLMEINELTGLQTVAVQVLEPKLSTTAIKNIDQDKPVKAKK